MAVLGDGARLATAARLAGLDPAQAGVMAHQLQRIEVLASEDPFAFVHPLVRRSVYDHLSAAERQDAHAAAADLLREAGAPPEVVATHLATTVPSGSSATATTLFGAGTRALTQAAPHEAVRWFARALDEGAAEPPAAVILAQLGMTEVVLSDMAALGHLREALGRAEDLALRTRIAVALAEILGHAGQWETAMSVIATAEQAVAGSGPELETEVAAVKALCTAYDPERVNEFERERPRFRRLAEGDGWAAHALAAMLAAAAALRGEGAHEVLPLVDRALEGGRLLGERRAGAWATGQLLSALMMVEAYDRAEAAVDLVAEASRREGALLGTVTARIGRGWCHARRGDLPAAEVELTTVLDMAADAGMPMVDVSAFYFVQDAILERPSLDPTATRVEATELDPVFERTWTGGMLREVRGRLRLARRDLDGGIADLRVVGRVATALRFGPGLSSWRSCLALALGPNDRDEASALVAEELDLARAAGLRRASGTALHAAGILEGGEPGIERLRESVSVLEATQAPLEHARSLVELGSALRRAGRRGEARAPLEAGVELARRCGAERLLARAQEERRAAGGRPRRAARTGRDALTASEQRVAQLAAGGATNTEIAQELYVSLKTIETHLSHAYGKLGLSGQGSRRRLVEALERQPAHA